MSGHHEHRDVGPTHHTTSVWAAACLAALQGGQARRAARSSKPQTPEPRPHSQKTALPDSRSHLRIKHFLGTSENAVKTQIWCAVATYVLIAIVKKELKLPASLYTLLQILSVSVFEKTQLQRALWADQDAQEIPDAAKQLILFDI
jgi:hypothetical protein